MNDLSTYLPDDVEHCSIRHMVERREHVAVRRDVAEPIHTSLDEGVMVSVWTGGGYGYSATNDLTDAGIRTALAEARRWAAITAGMSVLDAHPQGPTIGSHHPQIEREWDATSVAERLDLVRHQCAALGGDDRIVDRYASITRHDVDVTLVSSGGGHIEQSYRNVYPGMRVVAHEAGRTQIRSFGGFSIGQQGGREVLDRLGFDAASATLADDALELLHAPNCPSARMDALMAPDQMALQIHESIGHPLELDRILGDERNFAGTSFVTPDMFGTYDYGSELLNVTFDPTVDGEIASYAFDDDGTPAERQYLIRDGRLERPLGGIISQRRAGMDGVANSRSSAWNRPPIDRMANLNVEPGESSFEDLVSGVERGIYLETNSSWSIDDSRNKFQFSCEKGTLIEDGELTTVVRSPSYRGISSQFWRSLSGVGNEATNQVMGVPNCGKGEPSQVIWVGHASPACLFADVDVFGGES